MIATEDRAGARAGARARGENLEIGTEKPNLRLMLQQIEHAQSHQNDLIARYERAHRWASSRWDGQTTDARKHADAYGKEVFPWEGASDSRIRLVEQVINDHITVAKAAFERAQVQAYSTRPMAEGRGRRSNQVTKLLKWQLYTHMRAELQREIPLAWAWRFNLGSAVLRIDWEQARRLDYHEIGIPDVVDYFTLRDGLNEDDASALYLNLQAAFYDPAQEEQLLELVQQISPLMTRTTARKAVRELRQVGTTKIPTPYVFKSKPRWTARLIGVDVLFPDLTGDLQQEPWIVDIERISETDLRDRIETEDYSEEFVEAALRTKGRTNTNPGALQRAAWERSQFYGNGSFEEDQSRQIELYHFRYKAIAHGTPCLYRTVFSPHVTQPERGGDDDFIYATHGMDPYQHGQYPFVPMRFEKKHRPITSSQGIAEKAYSFELEIKTQVDGLNDRTDMIRQPAIVTSYSKAHSLNGRPFPGAVLPVSRPNEIQWMPLPGSDGTPVQVIAQVGARVERLFGLFGESIDPDLKQLRRQELANDVMGELALAIMMTKQLDEQFLPEEEVAATVGELQTPFNVSREELQQAREISVTFDARNLDVEHAKTTMELYQGAIQFNRNGNANFSGIFQRLIELFDPDAAETVAMDDQTASDRERREERQAFIEMMNGMEPDKPMFSNHQLRLDTLNEILQTPGQMDKVMADPVAAQLLQNRMEFHQAQLQQYGENPQIGRALSTKTFEKGKAPVMQLAGGAA